MFRDYSVPTRRTRPQLRLHIPLAAVVAGTLAIALVAKPGDASRSESIEITPPTMPAKRALPQVSSADDTTSWLNGDTLAFAPTARRAPDVEIPNHHGEFDAADNAHTEAVPAETEAEEALAWQQVVIESGQTLSGAFDAVGLGPSQWMQLLRIEHEMVSRLKRPKVGDVLRVRQSDGQLDELLLELSETETLRIARADDGFDVETLAADVETRPAYAHGEIDSSLFLAGKAAGMSDRLIMNMVAVLGYDIDFALDLRSGDRFIVLYDELYLNGEKLRDGDIRAIEFINRGRTVQAFAFTDSSGKPGFYREDGEAVKTAFLRNPLDVFRISSHYNPNRRHPVLNTIRAHRGTDYAAPTGTPIRSTGDGKVAFAGNRGGYGRTVEVQHGATYRTLYAHMSRIRSGIRSGTRVRQGQIIGYVGSSGLATGPHLHFEFLVNGTHRNPLTVQFPRSEPVPKQDMEAFASIADNYLQQIASLREIQTADAGGPAGN